MTFVLTKLTVTVMIVRKFTTVNIYTCSSRGFDAVLY